MGASYRELEERSYTGFRIDLAPLSERGRTGSGPFAKTPCSNQPSLLVASAVTLELTETASYLACAGPTLR